MSLLDLLTDHIGYNTLVVTTGVTLLGIAAGVVGTFTFLRRRSLLSDALSHATLPGICVAFLLGTYFNLPARSLPLLLFGAAFFAVLGLLSVQWISNHTRVNEDAAIGIALSSFFGLGVVLLTGIQALESGSQAGLGTFIMGQTAAMSLGEAWSIGLLALVAIVVTVFFFKELLLYSFDADFAQGQGWSVARLDLLVAGLSVFVTVIGLQSVGLILVVALLIIPPVSARFWTNRLTTMITLSGLFGGASAFAGAQLSSIYADFPTGAVIVLCAGVIFLVSLFFAPQRGIVASAVRRFKQELLLRSRQYLIALGDFQVNDSDAFDAAANARRLLPSWSLYRWFILWRLQLRGLISQNTLTEKGLVIAAESKVNLRLWEEYLNSSQETFPDRFIWGVDNIRDALSPETVALLEKNLASRSHLPTDV